jgi:hypothetical protein
MNVHKYSVEAKEVISLLRKATMFLRISERMDGCMKVHISLRESYLDLSSSTILAVTQ